MALDQTPQSYSDRHLRAAGVWRRYKRRCALFSIGIHSWFQSVSLLEFKCLKKKKEWLKKTCCIIFFPIPVANHVEWEVSWSIRWVLLCPGVEFGQVSCSAGVGGPAYQFKLKKTIENDRNQLYQVGSLHWIAPRKDWKKLSPRKRSTTLKESKKAATRSSWPACCSIWRWPGGRNQTVGWLEVPLVNQQQQQQQMDLKQPPLGMFFFGQTPTCLQAMVVDSRAEGSQTQFSIW